jgi:Ala-tRNA(Pro) deacylase
MSEDKLFADLADAGVAYEVHEHPAVFTVEESADLHARLPGDHTKNLFLKNDKGRFWLVTLPHNRRADLKFIGRQAGAGRLSFGKPDAMEALLGVAPGAVTPLAAINDEAGAVTIILDSAFAPETTINVHPLRNTATLALKTADLIALLKRWGHEPIVADLRPPED